VTSATSTGPLSAGGEQRAWGWVRHLLEGRTTPWQEWNGSGESQGLYLPGAQQLELLRRLNLAGRPSPSLATRVLEASAAGRGRPDLELLGVGSESEFGPAPVDPAGLPAGELVRVAASVLADELVESGLPEDQGEPRPSRWRRGYRLVGDPELADGFRHQLLARGRPPGGRRPVVVACGADLGTMLAHVWTHRAFGEGVTAWREWLRALRERGLLPPRADLAGVCRAWERKVGAARLHVVLDPAALTALVGERRSLTAPASGPGESGELARRVGSVLGLLVPPGERAALLASRLRPRIDAAVARSGLGRPLVVPPAHQEWVERAAERMRQEIKRSGYAVHGSLDALVPAWPGDLEPARAGPSPDVTLDLAVQVLLDPEIGPGGFHQEPDRAPVGSDDRRTA
jgi:hypothetical protein